ncbi:MAG: RHS repeat-associated core domain-containing protein [candidate division Zixibacteria bacterium]|nr:RHS repeat-associated core domain-containing protein [candidate division Zixibacteria bacterium]MDD5427412.1 RHS repeat-associated core domain-containing protein [candidate division Zixibacteria bacterium]
MNYDYRNLLDSANVQYNITGGANNIIWFGYDENSQRIKKRHKYQYWYCDSTGIIIRDNIEGGGDIDGVGEAGTDGSGGGCTWILTTAYNSTYYLYDNGVLLATFNAQDDVTDFFINGPTGRIATYHENDDEQMYFFLNDHLGSPRVIMHMRQDTTTQSYVAEYINYHPFGEILETYGSYDTPYRFTSKEHDQHSTFDYYYFGERYYNPHTGTFTSIDKAGQFASGYNYGGNNPIVGTDPDGNFFGFYLALFAYNMLNTYNQTGDFMQSFALSIMGTAKSYMSSAFASGITAGIGSNSALISRNISSASSNLTSSMMNGTSPSGFKLDFGIASVSLSSGETDWANFKNGDWVSDLGGLTALSQDINFYGYLSAEDRKTISDTKKQYMTERGFSGEYPNGYYGGDDIPKDLGEKLSKIGDKYYSHPGKLYDPIGLVSLIPNKLSGGKINIRKGWLTFLALGSGSDKHKIQYRLPLGYSVTQDIDENWRIHQNVDNNLLGGVGFLGHFAENNLKKPVSLFVEDYWHYKQIF